MRGDGRLAGAEGDVWFVYTRTPGRFSATPVGVKGQLAFLLCVGLTIAAGILIARVAFAWHPVVAAAGLGATIVTGVLLTCRLAIARGRPAR